MSEEANPTGPGPGTSSAPRRRRPRLRVYFETWLLSTFVVFACAVLWTLNEAANQKRAPSGLGATFLVAPVLALLGLPSLWLLRIFRERSPSSWLRFLRRLLLGALCGLFPAALLAAITAHRQATEIENLGVLWVSGLAFGLIAGLIDAMHLDAARDEDELAE